MCLTIEKGQKALIAEEDIIVYKLVEEFEGRYRSFYQLNPIELGEMYLSNIKVIKSGSKEDGWKITEGLHAYTTLELATSHIHILLCTWGYNAHIIKCIVPIRSRYYITGEQIASDMIKYTKEILATRKKYTHEEIFHTI